LVKSLKLHLPWIIWLIIIFILSLTPGNQLPDIEFDWFKIDTAVHIIMYLLLAFLILIGFFHQKNELSWQMGLCTIVATILTGLLIEFLQGSFIFQRYFSWGDFIANSAGTIAGYMTFKVYRKKELNLVRFLQ